MSVYVHSGSVTTFPENRHYRTQFCNMHQLINYNNYWDVTNIIMNIAYHHLEKMLSFLLMIKTKKYFSILRPLLKIKMVSYLIAGHISL